MIFRATANQCIASYLLARQMYDFEMGVKELNDTELLPSEEHLWEWSLDVERKVKVEGSMIDLNKLMEIMMPYRFKR